MTISEMKTKLANLEAQYDEVEEYAINGSHSVKKNLETLERQISTMRRRIARYYGYTGRVTPEFN